MMAIFVAVLALDLVTKYVFDAKLDVGETITVIPKVINFSMVHNFGAAWGMLAGKQVFLIVLTIIFMAIFVWYYIKENKVYAYIVIEERKLKYSYCYQESINNVKEGVCEWIIK